MVVLAHWLGQQTPRGISTVLRLAEDLIIGPGTPLHDTSKPSDLSETNDPPNPENPPPSDTPMPLDTPQDIGTSHIIENQSSLIETPTLIDSEHQNTVVIKPIDTLDDPMDSDPMEFKENIPLLLKTIATVIPKISIGQLTSQTTIVQL